MAQCQSEKMVNSDEATSDEVSDSGQDDEMEGGRKAGSDVV
jgi:hypothetical protein